jgi:hypothetical protein
MVSGNVPFERKLIEQSNRFNLPLPHHDSQSCLSQRLNQRTSVLATADFFNKIGQKATLSTPCFQYSGWPSTEIKAPTLGTGMARFPRGGFLRLAAGAAALPVFSRTASALDYPTRPIRYVVSSAAGGTQDISARLMAQWTPMSFTPGEFNRSTQHEEQLAIHNDNGLPTLARLAFSETLRTQLFYNVIFSAAPVPQKSL